MKLNYFAKSILICLLLAAASPSMAITTNPVTVNESVETRAVQLQNRLEEIKGLDKNSLSRVEKKALRKEVREIKKELAAISGGVYLSVGAIILIALLLILLL